PLLKARGNRAEAVVEFEPRSLQGWAAIVCKRTGKRNKKVAVHPCHVLARFFALFHEVRLMRKPHSPYHVKRCSWEHTEPWRASNLSVTLPGREAVQGADGAVA